MCSLGENKIETEPGNLMLEQRLVLREMRSLKKVLMQKWYKRRGALRVRPHSAKLTTIKRQAYAKKENHKAKFMQM